MNKEEFNDLLKQIGLECNEKQYNLLNKYADYLIYYNQKTNLTAITEKKDIFLKHFYDSLTLTKIINLNEYNTLLDIGSGAGFPGIVLKIFYSNLNVILIDSNNKKTDFLNSLIDKLNLTNIKTINSRVEDLPKNYLNSFDIVTARAVTNLRVLTEISLPYVKQKGNFIALKGKLNEELNLAKSTIEKMGASIIKIEKFSLPIENSERTLIKINKNRNTLAKELRPYNKILKTELK